MADWIEACAVDDISEEDVIRFHLRGRTFAVCRSPDDEFFATDGYCTHEKAHPAEALVIDDVIQCLEAYWPLQLRPARPRARRSASISRSIRREWRPAR